MKAIFAPTVFACLFFDVAGIQNLTWPVAFFANFTEDTWFSGGHQSTRGWIAYSWVHTAEVIAHEVGKLNPICNSIRPGDESQCVHHSVNGNTRYLLWPDKRECCIHCSKACGVESPSWVQAVPSVYMGVRQIGGTSCDEWVLQSDTPDRVALRVGDGAVCELYDGGANFVGDNPFQLSMDSASYTAQVDPQLLALPDYCNAARDCKGISMV